MSSIHFETCENASGIVMVNKREGLASTTKTTGLCLCHSHEVATEIATALTFYHAHHPTPSPDSLGSGSV